MPTREIKPRPSFGRIKRQRFLASLERMEVRQLLATFVVTTTSDVPAAGVTTLRQAITESNESTTAGANNIVFAIPAAKVVTNPAVTTQPYDVAFPGFNPSTQDWTIDLASPLPAITHQVTIDGYTQGQSGVPFNYPSESQYQTLALSGNPIGGTFTLTTSAPLPVGTVTLPYNATASQVQTALESIVGDNTADETNVSVTGSTDLPSGSYNIYFRGVYDGLNIQPLVTTSNLVPSTTTEPESSINEVQPIDPSLITSAPSSVAAKTGNNATPRVIIEGGGTAGGSGFEIDASDVNLRGMIIDGFNVGVSVDAGAVGDVIQGNDIGEYLAFPVDPVTGEPLTGPASEEILGIGNSAQGVLLASTNTTVGGVETQDANVIIGNGAQGVSILQGANGNQILGNQIGVAGPAITSDYFAVGNGGDGVLIADSSNYVGGQASGSGNVIDDNGGDGVDIVGTAATRNDVEGNYIGAGPDGGYILGSGDPGNALDGVAIDNAADNLIGGTSSAAQNVISSNGGDGVHIFDSTGGTTAVNNLIQGNIIGLTADGISVLGNSGQGVAIYTRDNTVDDTNIISANLEGVLLSGAGASGNLINGNLIGTNQAGSSKLGNAEAGVDVEDASNNTISGNARGSQLISGNNVGLLINGDTATGNLVVGNLIGTDISGTIDLGNANDGVEIDDAPGNTIGGSSATALNLISSNDTGVEIVGAQAVNTVLQGNNIGTDITGTLPLGNEVDGVFIHEGASTNSIGGSIATAGNIIAFNTRDGVRIADNSVGNSILSNSIFTNGGKGIDLVSTGTPPTTPNNLQAAPVLTSVTTSFTSTIVTGSLTSTPNTTFTIQFFSSASQSQALNEGGVLLGKATVVTGSNGIATFSANLPSLLQNGQYVTATATSPTGNTSQFTPTPITLPSGTGQSQTTFYVTNTNDSGAGSLRQAIMNANSSTSTGAVSVVFNIQSSDPNFSPTYQTWTIDLLSALPALTHQVTIDGFTETQESNITYVYPDDAAGDGTAITSTPSTESALDGNNATPRIVIDGSATNGSTGFAIDASGVDLRGLIITGFGVGVSVEAGAVGDVIQGNDIGKYQAFPVDPQTGQALKGAAAVAILGEGNSLQGILLASTNTTVGGVEAQDGNVIIGNGEQGISILAGAHGNQILGNQIGVVGPSASAGLYFTVGNGSDGVLIADSSNDVGGQVSGDGNLISGNGGDGVDIVGTAATRNDVEGNYIGVGPGGGFVLGSANPGNQGDGVAIDDAASNQIGGSTSAAQNVISGNNGDGVHIFDSTGGTSAVDNLVQGNIIGLTADGISILGNALDGVAIYSRDNTVDDTNIISANLDGVLLSGVGASGNLVNSNVIGTNSAGSGKLGNVDDGILIDGAPDNTISGNAKGSQLISGNNVGLLITGSTATGNLVTGNFIGTDSTGKIDLGNANDGVEIDNASGNTIGGPTTTATNPNVISANHTGVEIVGAQATDNVVQGNNIGTDLTGKLPLGSELDGIYIHQGASNNLIGGSIAADGNIIAFNSRDGVRIADNSVGDSILSNSIFANLGLGIDLYSTGTPPTTPNHLQAAPVLTSVATSVTSTIIDGTLKNSTPNTTYTIQFFSSSSQGQAANEGGAYLGQATVVTNSSGVASYSANLPTLLQNDQSVTATATDSAGNTSQFSAPLSQVFGTVQFQMTDYTVNEGVGTATITATRTGGSGGYFTVNYATADGTAVAGTDYQAASGTLTFNPGVDSQTFNITIDDNGLPSADTYLTVNLSDPVGPIVLGAGSSATLNILGNQPGAIQFQTSNYTVAEAAGTATITVTRQTAGTIAQVSYSTGGGNAIAGVDYTPTSGTLTFSQTALSETITIPILINPNIQGNVSLNVTLSNPTNGSTIGTPSYAVLTIQPAVYQFQAPSFTVGEADGSATITVTRSSDVGTTTVNYSTSNGSAVAGIDYVPTSGTLTFNPGQSEATFTVPILINPNIQGDETINLSLSSPAGGAILGSPSTVPLVIINDGVDRHGPAVTSVKAISGPVGVAEIVITFDEALNPATATNLLNYGYAVRTADRQGKLGTGEYHLIGIRSAKYNPNDFTVTLALTSPVKAGMPLEVQLNAATSVASAGVGISDLLGNLLDGNGDGYPGSPFTGDVVAQPAPKPVHAKVSAKTVNHKVKAASHAVKVTEAKSHPKGPAKTHAASRR